jgi:hypothetical protein
MGQIFAKPEPPKPRYLREDGRHSLTPPDKEETERMIKRRVKEEKLRKER